jgi:hypothetical protein
MLYPFLPLTPHLRQTADGKTKKLNSAIRIKGVDIVGKNIIVWSGKKAEV